MNKYRTEIDGIRALAIIPVIFFHFEVSYFSGGFFGVDIFFVISGYLITKIIYENLTNNKFSFSDFYYKRAKRLLPSLILVLFLILGIGFCFFDYLTYKYLGKEVFSSLLYFSNIIYYRSVGYFDTANKLKPLLHTWSLSVEEQFYLIFPFIFSITFRYLRKVRNLVILFSIILLISFWFNFFYNADNLSSKYYLPHFRIWEFLAGSITFLLLIDSTMTKIKYSTIIHSSGLVLIFCSFYFYSRFQLDILLLNILPVLATIILLIPLPNSLIYKFLQFNIFQQIGKISYSLYLWHWPIFVLFSYFYFKPFSTFQIIGLLLLTYCLAFLTWRFFENPIREEKIFNKKTFIKLILIITGTLSILSLFIFLEDGFPSRNKANKLLKEAVEDDYWEKLSKAENLNLSNNNFSEYIIGSKSEYPTTILWGDSHARALAYGFDKNYNKNNEACLLFTLSSTPPVLGINFLNSSVSLNKQNQKVIDYIKQNKSLKKVILCARWGYYIKEKNLSLLNREISLSDSVINDNYFLYGLKKTIDKLIELGKEIYIIYPVPELNYDIRNIIGHISANFYNVKLESYLENKNQYIKKNQLFLDFIKNYNINYKKLHLIEIQNFFYNDCNSIISNNHLLFRDQNHLSKFGSLYLVNSIFHRFKSN